MTKRPRVYRRLAEYGKTTTAHDMKRMQYKGSHERLDNLFLRSDFLTKVFVDSHIYISRRMRWAAFLFRMVVRRDYGLFFCYMR